MTFTEKENRRVIVAEASCKLTRSFCDINKELGGLTYAEWLTVFHSLSDKMIQEQLKEDWK